MNDESRSDGMGWLGDWAAELFASARRGTDPLIEDGQEALLRQARSLSGRARALNLRDDPEEILEGSPIFQPYPDSDLPPELQSVTWRGDALLGLSAFGAVTLEDEIARSTRRIFHDDLTHHELSRRLFGSDFDAVHGYMDTVPGATHRGGGIVHRLEHGHDLEAATEVYSEHGLPGVLVWTQHLVQDSTTPTGVPIPAGGPPLAEWLVEQELASPGKAALLVSFNVAELAAGFLAGAFALRLASLVAELHRKRRIVKRLERARDAWAEDDLDAVIAHYQEARSLVGGHDAGIDLALGWAYAATGRPAAESFLSFRSAAEGLGANDHPVEVNGIMVSLRGIAYLLALSQATQIFEFPDMQAAWRNELSRMARGAIASFESLAIAQSERFTAEVGGRPVQFLARPFSAAANYYLAARTAASFPFLPVAGEVTRLGDRALGELDRAEEEHLDVPAFSAVRERWSGELEPLRISA